jgi:hypothetical protein
MSHLAGCFGGPGVNGYVVWDRLLVNELRFFRFRNSPKLPELS